MIAATTFAPIMAPAKEANTAPSADHTFFTRATRTSMSEATNIATYTIFAVVKEYMKKEPRKTKKTILGRA